MESVALLFAGTRSTGWLAVTLAEVVKEATADGFTIVVTVALPFLGMVPNAQMTVPPLLLQEPWLAVAEINGTPAGKTLETTTEEALSGPRFVMVVTMERLLLITAGAGRAVMVS